MMEWQGSPGFTQVHFLLLWRMGQQYTLPTISELNSYKQKDVESLGG